MSRIGRLPIPLPDKVRVAVEGGLVKVEGPKGKMSRLVPGVKFEIGGGKVNVLRADESKRAREMHGLSRTLVANMVHGVSQGFERKLEIFGVGFKAEVKGSVVTFIVGYSHPVDFPLPEGITAEWKEMKAGDKTGELTIRGYDKETLGRVVSEMRKVRPPEPYKGKGIKYIEEHVRRKQGKTGAT